MYSQENIWLGRSEKYRISSFSVISQKLAHGWIVGRTVGGKLLRIPALYENSQSGIEFDNKTIYIQF
jgi:hypothetical protein